MIDIRSYRARALMTSGYQGHQVLSADFSLRCPDDTLLIAAVSMVR
jgi:hypothetical protein